MLATVVMSATLLTGCGDDSPNSDAFPTPSATSSRQTQASGGKACSYTEDNFASGQTKNVGVPPKTGVPTSGSPTATIKTNFGNVTIALARADAPCTVNSFTYLAGKNFYDDTQCHRLTTQKLFVLQCGDPFGTGQGGPSYRFGTENTPTDRNPPFRVGDVAMARTIDPNTNGSQFFIVYEDSPNLPGEYSLFGRVTAGLDVITDRIVPNGLASSDTPGDGKPARDVLVSDVSVDD